MVPPYSLRIPRVRRYSGYNQPTSLFAYETITLFGWASHPIQLSSVDTVYCPNPKGIATSGLACSGFARRYSRNRVCFLFLRLLRCFSSAGSLYNTMYSCCNSQLFTVRVSPFGNPRIYAYLLLPVAYRSLSRPSSAPSAKASALCSFMLDLHVDC